MTRIRWGVLGTSRIAEQQVIPAIKNAKNAEVVAVGSRSLETARRFAVRNDIANALGSYEELVASPDIDAVYIPLPNHLHAEWTIKAAEQGKHVLCEKPAALNAAQMRQVVSACDAHGVQFMEAFMYQFHPQWRRTLEIVESGELGELRLLQSAFTFVLSNPDDVRMISEMGGGSLYDVGCYCVHAMRTLTGNEALQEVSATAHFAKDGRVDKSLAAVLKFHNGVIGHFDSSFEAYSRQYFQVVGSEGTVTLPYPFRPDKGEPRLHIETLTGSRVETLPQGDLYVAEIEHFGDCINSGVTPYNRPEDSVWNMEFLDAVYKAAGR